MAFSLFKKRKKTKIKKAKEKIDYDSIRIISRKKLFILLWVSLLLSVGDNVVYGLPHLITIGAASALSVAGSLAFPLAAFWLVEIFHYIKIRGSKEWNRKIFLRLGLTALLCEIPFNLLKNGSLIYLTTQNILMTLFAGLLTVGFINLDLSKAASKITLKEKNIPSTERAMKFNFVVLICLLTAVANFDYGGEGVFLIAGLDIARKKKHIKLCQLFVFLFYILLRADLMYLFLLADLVFIFILSKGIDEPNKKKLLMKPSLSRALSLCANLFYPIQLIVIILLKLFLKAT